MKSKRISAVILLIVFAIALSSCNNNNERSNVIIEFDDGSKILDEIGTPFIFYSLFWGYGIDVTENGNRLMGPVGGIPHYEQLTEYENCITYAFDPSGYIAYHAISKKKEIAVTDEEAAVWHKVKLRHRTIYIEYEKFYLYDCDNRELHEFKTLKDIMDYCADNSVNLGGWYYTAGYDTKQEEILVSSDGWQLATNLYGISFIRKDWDTMFSGYIDRYSFDGDWLVFHLQIMEEEYYIGSENPLIEYDESTSIGRKYMSLYYDVYREIYTLGAYDIYTDNYIAVNTKTDEYNIFDSKKEAENYMESLGLKMKWEKI